MGGPETDPRGTAIDSGRCVSLAGHSLTETTAAHPGECPSIIARRAGVAVKISARRLQGQDAVGK